MSPQTRASSQRLTGGRPLQHRLSLGSRDLISHSGSSAYCQGINFFGAFCRTCILQESRPGPGADAFKMLRKSRSPDLVPSVIPFRTTMRRLINIASIPDMSFPYSFLARNKGVYSLQNPYMINPLLASCLQ